jgi:dienelactone hydrolase
MKTFSRLISMIAVLGLLAGCAQTPSTPAANTPQAAGTTAADFTALIPLAQTFIDQLAKGDFAAATGRFDGPMLNAMPEAKLKATWEQVLAQVGAFKQQTGTRTEMLQGYRAVYVTCQFEKAALDVRVVFNAQDQISGLQFLQAQSPATSFDTEITLAKTFVDQLAKGDFAPATAIFDTTMKSAMPEATLKETWQQLLAQVGAFQQQIGTYTTEQLGYKTVFVTCRFEKADIDVQVVFNSQDQISGLFFKPAAGTPTATPLAYNPPAYVNAGAFHEVDVTVGSGQWALPGTLTLPNGSGPFPAVVLVQGSGPSDRDETIGPNKPFRDLAWGLASQGVAVLRYDKRTYAHKDLLTPVVLATFTVQEETIDDALLAAKLLRQTQSIDPQRVFVLGHSLGGYLAPRIGQQDPSLAGMILLAGLARPLEETIVDQMTYIFNLDGTPTSDQNAQLDTLKTQEANVRDPNLTSSTPSSALLNAPAAYWLDLRGYQPVEVAKNLSMPMLVLQGGRDYQVTAADYDLWQAALGNKANATLKWYPSLNHLFFSGVGPITPQEYNVEGHVSPEVIRDITDWVLKH